MRGSDRRGLSNGLSSTVTIGRSRLSMEAALEEALAALGVASHTEEGLTGVWTARGKVAAIGVRVTRGVATHGFSLNVSIDLGAYAPIVPCGIDDRPVTSLTELLGRPVEVAEVRDLVVRSLGRALGVRWVEGRLPG